MRRSLVEHVVEQIGLVADGLERAFRSLHVFARLRFHLHQHALLAVAHRNLRALAGLQVQRADEEQPAEHVVHAGRDVDIPGTHDGVILGAVAFQIAGLPGLPVESDPGFAQTAAFVGGHLQALRAVGGVQVGGIIVLHLEQFGDDAGRFQVQIDLITGSRLRRRVHVHTGFARREKAPIDAVVESFPGGQRVALRKSGRRADEERQQPVEEHEKPVSHLRRQWRNVRARLGSSHVP